MSSAPAYRYDHAATRPARHLESAPSVRVVPGRKHAVYPTLSDGAVLGIKAIIACVIVFLVIGFVRVGLSSAAYKHRLAVERLARPDFRCAHHGRIACCAGEPSF